MSCALKITIVLVVCYWAGGSQACDVVARLPGGWVCGVRRWAEAGTVYASFRGVPYARQPLGELRFKELQPLDPWDEVYNATTEGPVCPQRDEIFGALMKPQGMSEACIHANIHVPDEALPNAEDSETKPGIPILVFIHGGAFESGSGDADFYGPEYLVSKGNIVITFNYRLNVFGFLSLNSVSVPGNQGLRDAITLLRWVQSNARAFGGDPGDVTLMGQSSGAVMAHLLTMSPAAEGLFNRSMLMSGTAIPYHYTASPKYAQEISGQFITELAINSTDPEEVHRQLVEMPLDTIMQAFYSIHDKHLTVFNPVVESSFPGVTRIIERDPEVLIKEGRGNNFPLIIGFTTAEYYSMQNMGKLSNLVDNIERNPRTLVPPNLVYSLSDEEVLDIGKKINQRYFNGAVTLDKALECSGDIAAVYPAIKLAQWRAAQGGAPVFLYQFSYKADYSPVKEALGLEYSGVGHMEDLSFVFRVNSMLGDHYSFPPENNDDTMKEWMTKFISSFMQCSHPSCDDRILEYEMWPQVDPNELKYQDIKQPKRYRVVEPTEQQLEMVQFFDSIYDSI